MTDTTLCPNCKTPLHGQFCSECGQNQKGIDRFLLTLVNEAFEDLFRWNSRAWRTLFGLMFKPGFLSKEYFKGRRARYVQPIRLYFITSILFFVILSVVNFFSSPIKIEISDGATEQTLNDLVDPAKEATEQPAIVISTVLSNERPTEERASEASSTDLSLAAGEKAELEKNQIIDFGFENMDLSLPFLSDETEEWLRNNFRSKMEGAILEARDNPGMVRDALLELIPPILFCLLPLFALLLKLAYVTRSFYYTEHLVLAVHNHSFVFITLTFYTLIEALLRNHQTLADWISAAVAITIPIYLWKSLKNVYQQGRFFTTVKFMTLGVLYLSALGSGILAALIIGALTL